MFNRLIKDKRGLTLVEALVSVLLLGLTVGAMLGGFVIGRLSITRVHHRAKAMNLLRARMEWVKAQGYSTVEGWAGTPIVESDVDDAVGTNELLDDTRTTTVVKDANDNLMVTVTLNWTKQGWGGPVTKGDEANPDEKLVTLMSP
ncbi:prepilin-type N-terminal cleavage/methylation domain-containing protein [Candidatus Omnitrophota bacterium]